MSGGTLRLLAVADRKIIGDGDGDAALPFFVELELAATDLRLTFHEFQAEWQTIL